VGEAADVTDMRLPFRPRSATVEQRYRALVEEMPLTLYISALDRRSGALYVSPAIAALVGRPVEAFYEDPLLFDRLLHPDDRERVLDAIEHSKRSGEQFADTYRMIHSDGSVVWVRDNAVTVRDERGTPLHWQGFLVDDTRRKEAEARYRALVEQLPLITYVDSPDSSYISPQVESILGHTSEEWYAAPGFFLAHLHPDDRDRVVAAQEEARRSGEALELEYRLRAADGSYVWLHDSYTVVEDEAGRPWYTQGFAVDVTARKLAEHELEAQNAQLRQVDRMKDEFIALVSHELRTPLTSICGYLELLAGDLGDEHGETIDVIERNSHRLLRLVEDLLLTAQVSAGTLSLEEGEVDVEQLVRHAVAAAAPVAAAREIELACRATSLPPVSGDRVRLGQVVDNLVANALKFTPPGGRVEISAEGEDGLVRIEVSDTGRGISVEEQARVFDRFFRTEQTERDAIPGVGLGLAIARAIVEGHGGRIGIESTPGAGTTFSVELVAERGAPVHAR
jgi:PAS domain S-box-containing protein